MRIHYLQHVPFEGLGSIAGWAERRGPGELHPSFCRGYTADQGEFDFLIIMGGPMGVYDEGEFPWLGRKRYSCRQRSRRKRRFSASALAPSFLPPSSGRWWRVTASGRLAGFRYSTAWKFQRPYLSAARRPAGLPLAWRYLRHPKRAPCLSAQVRPAATRPSCLANGFSACSFIWKRRRKALPG